MHSWCRETLLGRQSSQGSWIDAPSPSKLPAPTTAQLSRLSQPTSPAASLSDRCTAAWDAALPQPIPVSTPSSHEIRTSSHTVGSPAYDAAASIRVSPRIAALADWDVRPASPRSPPRSAKTVRPCDRKPRVGFQGGSAPSSVLLPACALSACYCNRKHLRHSLLEQDPTEVQVILRSMQVCRSISYAAYMVMNGCMCMMGMAPWLETVGAHIRLIYKLSCVIQYMCHHQLAQVPPAVCLGWSNLPLPMVRLPLPIVRLPLTSWMGTR